MCFLQGGFKVQVQVRLSRQIRALGQVLAQQAVCILIGPALRGAVRIGKEHLECELLSQTFVFGHLFALIVGQFLCSGAGTCRSFLVKPSRALIASVPSVRARMTRRIVHSTKVPTADQLRAPPFRRHLGGTLGDGHHIEELPAAVGPPRAGTAFLAILP